MVTNSAVYCGIFINYFFYRNFQNFQLIFAKETCAVFTARGLYVDQKLQQKNILFSTK